MAPRRQAAWWPKRSRGGAISGSEHGSTLTSSVVAGIREVISATVATSWRSGKRNEIERLLMAYSLGLRAICDLSRRQIAEGKGVSHEQFWAGVEARKDPKRRVKTTVKSA